MLVCCLFAYFVVIVLHFVIIFSALNILFRVTMILPTPSVAKSNVTLSSEAGSDARTGNGGSVDRVRASLILNQGRIHSCIFHGVGPCCATCCRPLMLPKIKNLLIAKLLKQRCAADQWPFLCKLTAVGNVLQSERKLKSCQF